MNGPELWQQILTDVRTNEAEITGGCVRDWFFGMPVKDIDVFIGRRANLTRDTFQMPAAWALDPADEQFQLDWGDYNGNPAINSIGNYIVQDTKVQVMFLNEAVWDARRRFDNHLALGSFNTFSGLHLPQKFLEDVFGKKITVKQQQEKNVQRAESLLLKLYENGYEGWRIEYQTDGFA